MDYDVVIIGAGLSGAVMADQFARKQNKKVLILEKRNHIAGNCYDYVDSETEILVSEYGPHFFHTNDKDVWKYLFQLCQHNFLPWENIVIVDELPSPPDTRGSGGFGSTGLRLENHPRT